MNVNITLVRNFNTKDFLCMVIVCGVHHSLTALVESIKKQKKTFHLLNQEQFNVWTHFLFVRNDFLRAKYCDRKALHVCSPPLCKIHARQECWQSEILRWQVFILLVLWLLLIAFLIAFIPLVAFTVFVCLLLTAFDCFRLQVHIHVRVVYTLDFRIYLPVRNVVYVVGKGSENGVMKNIFLIYM